MFVGSATTVDTFIVGVDFGDGQTGRASGWFEMWFKVSRLANLSLATVPRNLRDWFARQRAYQLCRLAI